MRLSSSSATARRALARALSGGATPTAPHSPSKPTPGPSVSTLTASRQERRRFSTQSAARDAEHTSGAPRGRGRQRGLGSGGILPPYPAWKRGIGRQLYEKPPPGPGPHWISDTSVRDEIWSLHASDPKKWGPREIGQRYSLALVRVEAVLRLKALEAEWRLQGKPLQTAFTKNMERLLGSERLAQTSARAALSRGRGQLGDLQDEAAAEKPASGSSADGGGGGGAGGGGGEGGGDIRGPIRDEVGETAEEVARPSAIVEALRRSDEAHATRLARLPTGGPARPRPSAGGGAEGETGAAATTITSTSVPATGSTRPAIRFTEVPPRSYLGAGVVARNERRAERRRSGNGNKAKRREAAAQGEGGKGSGGRRGA